MQIDYEPYSVHNITTTVERLIHVMLNLNCILRHHERTWGKSAPCSGNYHSLQTRGICLIQKKSTFSPILSSSQALLCSDLQSLRNLSS